MKVSWKVIKTGIENFGLGRGSRIMVHSSLSSFGWVTGGAKAVINALMESVGTEGTILMPSFNHGAPFRKGGTGIYDPLKTRCTSGRIPDTFWRMGNVYRSLNPTHPFAAWGKDAERYTKNHHLTLTMGENSPLGLLARDDGYQINMGTTHHTTTAKHLAETVNRSPCLGYRTEEYPVKLPDGRLAYHRAWGWRERSCPLTESGEHIESEMERLKLQHKRYIGKSLATCFRLRDLLKAVLNLLEKGYLGFPPCSRCPIQPQKTAVTRDSDCKDAYNKPDPKALFAL
jgi:aminoglycoside N3'-acetyltransferase